MGGEGCWGLVVCNWELVVGISELEVCLGSTHYFGKLVFRSWWSPRRWWSRSPRREERDWIVFISPRTWVAVEFIAESVCRSKIEDPIQGRSEIGPYLEGHTSGVFSFSQSLARSSPVPALPRRATGAFDREPIQTRRSALTSERYL
jgi:hypothetical protein